MKTKQKYFGKYRGSVLNNIDPMRIGRLLVRVPDVPGLMPTSWAMPSFPVAGKQMGIWAIPNIGSGVWVEFEQGDPNLPIWSGSWFGSAADVPALALEGNPASPSIVLQTSMQNSITISDLPGPAGGIVLKSTSGAMIAIGDAGITITNGKGAIIKMTGPTVDLNGGALTII